MGRHSMGESGHPVMWAALRRGPDGYGVSIIEEIEGRTGRDVSQTAAYLTLKRLERLERSRDERTNLWEGLAPELGR